MRQSYELVVGCALSRRNGVQTGQSGFNLRLGALHVVLLRFAGRRRAKPHMKCRHFTLQAGKLLQFVEGHDDRAGFKSRAAMIDSDHGERGALNLKRFTNLLVQVAGQDVA